MMMRRYDYHDDEGVVYLSMEQGDDNINCDDTGNYNIEMRGWFTLVWSKVGLL